MGRPPRTGDGWKEIFINPEAAGCTLDAALVMCHSILVVQSLASMAECDALCQYSEASVAKLEPHSQQSSEGFGRYRMPCELQAFLAPLPQTSLGAAPSDLYTPLHSKLTGMWARAFDAG